MLAHDIKKALELLIQYKSVEITHSFDEYVLSYTNSSQEFQLENTSTGIIEKFSDISACHDAVSKLIKIEN